MMQPQQHRRPSHYREDGATYAITWSVEQGKVDLAPSERTIVGNAIRFFDELRYDLSAYVVMNNHVHIVLKPFLSFSIHELIHSWKSYSANKMSRETGRRGGVWQRGYYAHLVRDDDDLQRQLEYVVDNPRRRWPGIVTYPWAWHAGDGPEGREREAQTTAPRAALWRGGGAPSEEGVEPRTPSIAAPQVDRMGVAGQSGGMSRYDDVRAALAKDPKTWLVTGAAGFIGSHLVETLLGLGQRVIGLDNLATGTRENIEDAARGHPLFTFHEGDICDRGIVDVAIAGVDVVLHQAALGSVPRSIKDPLATNRANVDGFVTMLTATKDAGVKKFVYASSSSVYGDHPDLPKVEEKIGNPLSPYAASKRVDEVYAAAFAAAYGLDCVGLRYFNVFGPRQSKDGPYAAVIPVWVGAMLKGAPCVINGDGETSRDFCYVDNAVQANVLAGVTAFAVDDKAGAHDVFNVACGARTTLTSLHDMLHAGLAKRHKAPQSSTPRYGSFRSGDVRHSLADVSKAARLLGYAPTHDVKAGLDVALDWYVDHA